MKYRVKPTYLVDAVQWRKTGDHDKISPTEEELDEYWTEIYFPNGICDDCNAPVKSHGLLDTGDSYIPVCPGDYVVTYNEGDIEIYSEDQFHIHFEPANKE